MAPEPTGPTPTPSASAPTPAPTADVPAEPVATDVPPVPTASPTTPDLTPEASVEPPATMDPPAPDVPVVIDDSEEAFAALLSSEAYREPPWVAQTDEPRPASHSTSPHGDVRVFANEVLIRSIASGMGVTEDENGELIAATTGHEPGAMAVKEFYQDGAVVGRAALLKVEGAPSNMTYYCDGPAELCGVEGASPIYGTGLSVGCGFCHGGLVYTISFPSE